VELVADRFLVTHASAAIDLATRLRVRLLPLPPAGVAEESSWSERCDRLQRQSSGGAVLVDYGVLGESRRFEAWSAPGARAADPADARPVFADESCIDELFAWTDDPTPRLVALMGEPGPVRSAAIRVLARRARLAGFVPVALEWFMASPRNGPELSALVKDRSVFLLDGGRAAADVDREKSRMWAVLVGQCLVSPRQHVGALVTRVEIPGLDCLRLACGQGGPRRRTASCRVAERTAPYLVGIPGGLDGSRRAPSETDVDAAREIDRAAEMVLHGRRSCGERTLREAARAAARHGAWQQAKRGALCLAEALIARGRARDALSAAEDAREYGVRAGDGEAVQAAVVAGRAWIDLCRLEDAERVLTAAVAGARPGEEGGAMLARAELARCLWWRGRFHEAETVLSGSSPARCLAEACVQVLLALGIGDPEGALARARTAVGLAEQGSAAAPRGQAAIAAAWAHLGAGNLEAVGPHGATAIAAGRIGRDPVCTVTGRLLVAESLRRLGRVAEAVPILRDLDRLAPKLSPLLRAQVAFLGEVARCGDPSAVLKRHIGATGLHGLALLLPAAQRVDAAATGLGACLVQIVQACQAVGDDMAVLRDVCARLRRQTRADGVSIFAATGGAPELLVRDGRRGDPSTAARCLALGLLIEPRGMDGAGGAAAPIVCAGRVLGVLVVSWPLGSCRDHAHARGLLPLAATAAAPLVAAVLADRRARAAGGDTELLGTSEPIQAVRRAVEAAAPAPFPVLVSGESGTGKELVARALWRRSPRASRAFVSVNCAALPDDLVEAELFGHARGSFTGATADRAGVFEEAHGGTLFLDEVGELSPRAQAKLLRVVQDGELRRVGENIARRVDVRIITATNRELRQEAEAGRFRRDLVYRLDVVRIALPPLRERREDIALLADAAWRGAAARIGSRATLGTDAVEALTRYDWPGNVRELQNVLAALAVRCPRRGVVRAGTLPPELRTTGPAEDGRLESARRGFEERFVRAALARVGGRQARAAAELGITRQGLTKLMKRLGIESRHRT
jgi:DNA-binding NtrC family response regulator